MPKPESKPRDRRVHDGTTTFTVPKKATVRNYEDTVDSAVSAYFNKHPEKRSLQDASFTVHDFGKNGTDSVKALIATGAKVELKNCADNKNHDLLLLKYAADTLRDSLQAKNKTLPPDEFAQVLFQQLKQMKKAGMEVSPYDILPKSIRAQAADKIQENTQLPQVIPGWFNKTSYRLKEQTKESYEAAVDTLLANINKKGRNPAKTTAVVRGFNSDGVDAIKGLIASGVQVTLKDFKGSAGELADLERLNKAAVALRQRKPPVKPQDFAKLLREEAGNVLLPQAIVDKVQPKLDANIKATLKSVGGIKTGITATVKNKSDYENVIGKYLEKNPDVTKGVANLRNFGPQGTDAIKSLVATGKRVKIINFKGNSQQKKELVQLQMAAALVRNDLRQQSKALDPKEFPHLLEEKLKQLQKQGLKMNPDKILPKIVQDKAIDMAPEPMPLLAPEETKKPQPAKSGERTVKAEAEREKEVEVKPMLSTTGHKIDMVKEESGNIKANLNAERRSADVAPGDGAPAPLPETPVASLQPPPQVLKTSASSWTSPGQQEIKKETAEDKVQLQEQTIKHDREVKSTPTPTVPTPPKPGTSNANKLDEQKQLNQQRQDQLRLQQQRENERLIRERRLQEQQRQKKPTMLSAWASKAILKKKELAKELAENAKKSKLAYGMSG